MSPSTFDLCTDMLTASFLGELAANPDSWDVSFMGVASSRAKTVAFSDPYAEIPCSFLVPKGIHLFIKIILSANQKYPIHLISRIENISYTRNRERRAVCGGGPRGVVQGRRLRPLVGTEPPHRRRLHPCSGRIMAGLSHRGRPRPNTYESVRVLF